MSSSPDMGENTESATLPNTQDAQSAGLETQTSSIIGFREVPESSRAIDDGEGDNITMAVAVPVQQFDTSSFPLATASVPSNVVSPTSPPHPLPVTAPEASVAPTASVQSGHGTSPPQVQPSLPLNTTVINGTVKGIIIGGAPAVQGVINTSPTQTFSLELPSTDTDTMIQAKLDPQTPMTVPVIVTGTILNEPPVASNSHYTTTSLLNVFFSAPLIWRDRQGINLVRFCAIL